VTGTASIKIDIVQPRLCDSLEVTYSQTSLSTLLGSIDVLTPTIKVRDAKNNYIPDPMSECIITVTHGAAWPAASHFTLGTNGDVTIDTSSLNPAHVGNFNLEVDFEVIEISDSS